MAKTWTRVNKDRRCPICGKPDWCGFCGATVHCMRVESTRPVESGGWFHDYENQEAVTLPDVVQKPRRTDSEMHALWAPRARHWWKDQGAQVYRLAERLGVASRALEAIYCGHDGRAWTFPERNQSGLIIGVVRRFEDGKKMCAKGSRRGLTYSDNWSDGTGPILCVEGQSDVAAGLTMGLAVIGRPSNSGGIAMLASLLAQHRDRRVVILGERDKKEDGQFPGLDGARRVVQGLAKRGIRAVCMLPPVGSKDLREYWRNTGAKVEDGFEVGRELIAKLGGRTRGC